MSHRQRSVLQVEELESRLTPMQVTDAILNAFLLHDANHDHRITYGPGLEVQDPTDIEGAARIDRNHDHSLTRGEVTHFLRREVDLNHDRQLDDIELALFSLREPAAHYFFFPY